MVYGHNMPDHLENHMVIEKEEDAPDNNLKKSFMAIKKSITGYKRNSPDKGAKKLRIPSNHITMQGVDIPLQLISSEGDIVNASPGDPDIIFPDNVKYVDEYPTKGKKKAQQGLKIPKQGSDISSLNSGPFKGYIPRWHPGDEMADRPLVKIPPTTYLSQTPDYSEYDKKQMSINRQKLNEEYANTHPETEVNQYGDLTKSGYGDFMDKYGKTLDRAGNMGETMMDIGMGIEGAGLVGKLAKKAGNYLVENTVLKNAYKLNPRAFKPNPEAYYRMIGEGGYKDAMESGVIRPPQKHYQIAQGIPKEGTPGVVYKDGVPYNELNIPQYDEAFYNAKYPLDKRWYPENKVSKNVPRSNGPLKRRNGYDGPYMAEVNGQDELFNYAENVASYNGPNAANTITTSKGFIPASNAGVKFYKEHWLQGYKEVPKKAFKQGGQIQSDWEIVPESEWEVVY